jgi:hypothetical protein
LKKVSLLAGPVLAAALTSPAHVNAKLPHTEPPVEKVEEAAAAALAAMAESGEIMVDPATGLLLLKPSILIRLRDAGLLNEKSFEYSSDCVDWGPN